MMTSEEFLVAVLDAVPGNRAVYSIRAPQTSEKSGVKTPSIIWRMDGQRNESGLDGPSYPHMKFYEIECRGNSASAARRLAGLVLYGLRGPLLGLELAAYDEPDDPSQKRGDYYSHILEVGLNEVS